MLILILYSILFFILLYFYCIPFAVYFIVVLNFYSYCCFYRSIYYNFHFI